MQTTVENTDTHTVKLTVEVSPEEFDADLDRAYRSIANQVKIPGFRKGKVPKQIIDAQVGRDVVLEEFLSDAVPAYFRSAVRDEDLAPIAEPDIDLQQVEDGKPLIFTAVVEVRPRLELTDYKGVKVTKPDTAVTDEEVDDWIERMRDRFAELEPVTRKAHENDFVVMDITATLGSEKLEDATRTDYLYGIGNGEFGDNLDKELIGKGAGDILKVSEDLPEGLENPDNPAKKVDFQVLVKEVKAKRLPEPDDEFAKTTSEFDTLDELKADLREKLHELKDREVNAIVRDRVLAAMIERVDVDIPETLIADETEHRVHTATDRATRSGLTLDQVLEAQGWDEERFREDARDHALRAIKADLVLEAVARAENVDVDADEIGQEIQTLAQAYGRNPTELAKALDKSGQIVTLAGDIIRTKALDLLVEHADIEAETGTEPDEESTQTEAEPSPAAEAETSSVSEPEEPSEEGT